MDDVIPATPEQIRARFRSACANWRAIEEMVDTLEQQEDVGILSGGWQREEASDVDWREVGGSRLGRMVRIGESVHGETVGVGSARHERPMWIKPSRPRSARFMANGAS
jgi:hypothetical protein